MRTNKTRTASYGVVLILLAMWFMRLWAGTLTDMRSHNDFRDYFIPFWLFVVLPMCLVFGGIFFSKIFEVLKWNRIYFVVVFLSIFELLLVVHMKYRYASPKPHLEWPGFISLMVAMYAAIRLKPLIVAWFVCLAVLILTGFTAITLVRLYANPSKNMAEVSVVLVALLTMFPCLIGETLITIVERFSGRFSK